MVCFHRAVLCIDGGSFDQRQQVSLHPFTRYVGASQSFTSGDLVDLVEEHDSVLLDCAYRFLYELIIVEQLVGLLVHQNVMRFLDADPAGLGTATAELSENVAKIDGAHLRSRHAGNFEHWHAGTAHLHFDLDFLVVELTAAQLFPETFARGRTCSRTNKRIEHAFFGRLLSARLHVFSFSIADQRNADFEQIANDLLNIASNIANFGKFGSLDLEKRGAGEPGKSAGNFGLSNPRWANHQNIFWKNFLAQLLIELQSPPTVAQCNRDRAFCIPLADDIAVKLRNDFAGREVRHVFRTIKRAQPSGVSTSRLFRNPAFSYARTARVLAGSGSVTTRGAPPANKRSLKARIKAEPCPQSSMSASPMN